MSSLKLLWLDELITLHIARLRTAADIWRALAAGADPNPPVTHLLVHASRLLLGEHEYALRLPAMVGYWLGMLCLFLYLKRRIPPVWALAGVLLSMTMAAFDYSFESRSYAIFYGFAMAAFYCWSLAVDSTCGSKTRLLALAGMSLALMVGISTNYFAVLAFLPITAGELARTWVKERSRFLLHPQESIASRLIAAVSLPVAAALAIALTPLLLYRSMIAHSIAEFAPHAWNRVSVDQAFDSYTQMVEIVLYLLLTLFVLYGALRCLARLCGTCRRDVRPMWLRGIIEQQTHQRKLLPVHELTGVLFLMLYPFLGYVLASVRGGMMSPRFVIPVCFGFSIAGSVVAYRLFGSMRHAGMAMLGFCLLWFIARESFVGYWYAEQKQCFYKVLDRIPLADSMVPGRHAIAVPDPLMALTLQYYASPEVSSRMVFPIDFPAIRKFRREDSPEQNIWAGRQTLYTLHVMPLASFQQGAGDYLVLASDWNWLLQDLDRHHYPEHRLPINTRAGAIGGFTPLSHGLPAFYIASGGQTPTGPLVPEDLPFPFQLSANLPNAPDMN